MKKCKFCGADLEDYQTRCSNCGLNQPNEDRQIQHSNKGNKHDAPKNTIANNVKPKHSRHIFITIWLWIIIVFGTLLFLIELFPTQAWGANYPDDMITLSRLSAVMTFFIITGAVLLLFRLKRGFYLITCCAIIGALTNILLGSFPFTLIGLLILWLVLHLKKNGIRYWDTLI